MIEIQNLTFTYPNQKEPTLHNLSISFKKGDYISIMGSNGCGKSTLLRIILGFLKPTTGTVTIDTDKIRYVSQKNDFAHAGFPITVKEILDSYRKLLGIKDKQEVDRVLALTDMAAFKDRLIGELSGGQAQRVAIARALIGQPDLIILDEPSTGIDRQNQEYMYDLLKQLNTENHITILSVEHNLEAALRNSTCIYHIHAGHGHLCTPEHYAKEVLAGE